MLFLLMIIPVTVFSQSDSLLRIFSSIPENSRPVHLPERLYTPEYNLDDSFNVWQILRVYTIKSDSVYHLVFQRYNLTKDSLRKMTSGPDSLWYIEDDSAMYKSYCRYLVDSLPVFDFLKVELIMYSACIYCLETCDHNNGERESCHRGGCWYIDKWFVKEKQPLITQKKSSHD